MNGYTLGDTVMWFRDGEQACVLTGRVINFTDKELVVSGTEGLVYWVDYDWITTTP